eukprot:11632698-Heterocapsa_arctica.AAC.1
MKHCKEHTNMNIGDNMLLGWYVYISLKYNYAAEMSDASGHRPLHYMIDIKNYCQKHLYELMMDRAHDYAGGEHRHPATLIEC